MCFQENIRQEWNSITYKPCKHNKRHVAFRRARQSIKDFLESTDVIVHFVRMYRTKFSFNDLNVRFSHS